MKKEADLHVHTNFSDGTFTPEETMAYAKRQNLSCIAIADHDNVDAIPTAINLQGAYNIELIPAVEITAQEDGKELHILGYFIDWQSKNLKEKLEKICQVRRDRLYEMVDKLKDYGINADAEKIIKYAKSKAISRLHVAKYLVEKGYLTSLKTAFNKYIGDGKPCYVGHFKFSSKEAIDNIKESGGIAVIAHPGLDNVSNCLPTLVKNGIEGIEVYHSDHTKSTTESLKDFAREHNLLMTGGSDCHGDNKRQRLMGKIRLPYEYVEKLKKYRAERSRQSIVGSR